jgi:hypothetical protein
VILFLIKIKIERWKEMNNILLRQYAKNHGVYLWELATKLKVSEATITRKFRTEMSDEDATKIKNAIDQIFENKAKQSIL